MKLPSGNICILAMTALLGCSALAFAAPQSAASGLLPPPNQDVMGTLPAQPPLYALSQQTTTPAETLSGVVKNLPAVEKGKKYEIRVEIREMTPLPVPDTDNQ
ncbi:hypothetical protein ACQP8C_06780 [Escherichia coli]|uniref:hypothetical protein n=1 Tax=Escherichia coli TaxID=562 RepID=UPI003D05345B